MLEWLGGYLAFGFHCVVGGDVASGVGEQAVVDVLESMQQSMRWRASISRCVGEQAAVAAAFVGRGRDGSAVDAASSCFSVDCGVSYREPSCACWSRSLLPGSAGLSCAWHRF